MPRRGSIGDLAVVAATVVAVVVPIVVVGYVAADRCAGTGGTLSPTAAVDARGVLSISGGLDDAMLAAVRRALAATTDRVTLIRVDSFGGQNEAAKELVDILGHLDAPMDVPPGATCQSACVALLAYAPGPVTVSPTATPMFHSEAYRTGLAERGFCGVANVMTVWATPVVLWLGRQILWLRRHIGWESPPMDSPPIMLDWAARLSARLPTLFDLCPVNPLRTQSGMTLTGAELAGLRDGSLPPSALTAKCPTS